MKSQYRNCEIITDLAHPHYVGLRYNSGQAHECTNWISPTVARNMAKQAKTEKDVGFWNEVKSALWNSVAEDLLEQHHDLWEQLAQAQMEV